jgi:tetratricopeptide (TPR) repeat protein
VANEGALSGDTGELRSWQQMRQRGAEQSQRGELARALESLRRAIDTYRSEGLSELLCELEAELGDVQLELGHSDDAIARYRQSLGLAQQAQNDVAVASAHRRIGMAYQEKWDLPRAEESYREADRLLESVDDEIEGAQLRVHWGSLFEDLGTFKKARKEYEEALRIYRSLSDRGGEAMAHRRLASVLHELDALSEAEQELHLARTLLDQQESQDAPELIEVLNLLGRIYEDQGRTSDAMERYEEAYHRADTLDIAPAKVECLRRMGSALAVKGKLKDSVERYQQAIEICRHLDDRRELAEIYGDLGDVYVEQGNLREAEKVFKSAAERLDHDNPRGLALAKRRLGELYQEKGEYKRAEEYYSEAESLLDNLDDAGERAILYTAWGSLHQEGGYLRDALSKYKQALAINEGNRQLRGEAICRRHIGSALHDQGRLEQAEGELRRAQALFEQQGSEDKPELIEVYNQLGSVLQDQGRISDALALFDDAHNLAGTLGIGPAKVESLRCMGSALAASGNLSDAEERYREAIILCDQQKDEVALSALYGEFGDVLFEQGLLEDAIDAYKSSLTYDQNHQDRLGMASANRRLGTAYQRRGDHDRARDYYKEAERQLRDLEDEDERALLRLHQGSSYEDQGLYSKALSEYNKARGFYEQQRNALRTAFAARCEGSAQLQLNLVSEAESRANFALEQLSGIEDKPEEIECLNLLGAVRRGQGRRDEAYDLHLQALALADSLSLQPARASSLRHLATVLVERQEEGQKKALERLQAALAIYESLEDEVNCSELHDDIADVSLLLGQIDEAVNHYETGLRIARKLDRHALTADILLGLARCKRHLGKLEGVRVHLDEARQMIDQIDSSPSRQARLRLEMAQILEDEGKPEAAIEGYEKALSAFLECNDPLGSLECHRLLLAAHTKKGNFPEAGHHLSKTLFLEGNMEALWAVMLDQLHPTIGESAKGPFAENRYGSGVLEAMKACERELRSRAGADRNMKMPETVTRCLDTERRGGLAPWVEQVHLEAFRKMCVGAFECCRNPLAHNQLPMDASQAFAWLGVTHLMLTLVDAPEAAETVTVGAGEMA